jgi:hypothetical protein
VIEILKFEMVNKGSLIARFNVKMHKWGGLVIKDCSLFESNGKKWVNLPARMYEVDGKKKYAEYIGYEDRSLNDKFKEGILHAAEEMRNRNPGQVKSDSDEIPF